MIKKIDHIAVSVSNIEEIIKELEYLGLPNQGIKKFEQIGMKIAFIGNNETQIELGEVYSRSVKTPVIEGHKGLHHIAVKAEDIDLMYSTLKENSKYTIIGELRKGAHGKVFFFKIKELENTLFECVE